LNRQTPSRRRSAIRSSIRATGLPHAWSYSCNGPR
jgi:hypothetical protein